MAFLRAVTAKISSLVARPFSRTDEANTTRPAKPQPSIDEARKLSHGILRGFGETIAPRLESIKLSSDATRVGYAAQGLAIWYVQRKDYNRALDNFALLRLANPAACRDTDLFALEVRALLETGRIHDANTLVEKATSTLGRTPTFCFCAANVAGASSALTQMERERQRLEWLNKPLTLAGVAPLAVKDVNLPLAFDNFLAVRASHHPHATDAKISVLMPAFNAADTIAVAIESVLEQTWRNWELLIVDDASEDDTWNVIQSFAALDSRIIALRNSRNQGAYRVRNTALEHATGDFVTVNDADDWSHPERLALQLRGLLVSGHALNTTHHIRVYSNLHVETREHGSMMTECFASLMVRTREIRDVGGWDQCKVAADSELYSRLRTKLGCQRNILATAPLVLASLRKESLTQRTDLGLQTIFYGARREYKEAYSFWHRDEARGLKPDFRLRSSQRRFPAPNICRSPGTPLLYDVLVVGDFSSGSASVPDTAQILRAAKCLTLNCGCYHWPYLENVNKATANDIRQLIHDGVAAAIVCGEKVSCQLVIVVGVSSLNQMPDSLPQISADSCIVIVDERPTTPQTRVFDVGTIVKNAEIAFRHTPFLAPAWPSVRRALEWDSPARLTPVDWMPLVDTGQINTVTPRPNPSRPPTIGRHGRERQNSWLRNPERLRDAFCMGRNVNVRVLGTVEIPKRILGNLPNWTAVAPDSIALNAFLASLDFFVDYPREDEIYPASRAPLEAMAAAIPAILPPKAEEVFSYGAVYAEPKRVYETVERLWNNSSEYRLQVERGMEFLKEHCGVAAFEGRLSRCGFEGVSSFPSQMVL